MNIPKEVLDEHRDINIDHEWWDNVEYDFKQDMEAIGIDVSRIYFGGFWSQGDGACFEATVQDWRKFLPSIGLTDPTLIQLAYSTWSWMVDRGSGCYVHSRSVFHDVSIEHPNNEYWAVDEDFARECLPNDIDKFRAKVSIAILKTFDYDQIEDDIRQALTDHMDTLYRRLEQEHEYLTSDECVAEAVDYLLNTGETNEKV